MIAKAAATRASNGGTPLTDLAVLPAHYERDIRWEIKGSVVASDRYTLLSPTRMTCNVGGIGYALTDQAQLDLSQAASWDTISPTDYTVAANRAGKDFYVYACQQAGTSPKLILSANSTVPSGYTSGNSRKIGGFHCLCKGTSITTPGVTVGLPAGNRMRDFETGDIIPLSIWDIKWRVKPYYRQEGRVFDDRRGEWIDIYMASQTGGNTTSIFGGTISDTRNWMDFSDDGALSGSGHMLRDAQFQSAAYGSNEQTNISGSADPVTTGGHVDTSGRRMISDIGCEDCCGVMWQWLDEQSYRFDSAASHAHTENTAAIYTQNATTGAPSVDIAPAFSYYALPGSKGQIYKQGTYGDVKLLAGAGWANGATAGSRSRYSLHSRWYTLSAIGCRFAAEPI